MISPRALGYVGTAGIHLPYVFYPNSYTGADPAFAPFTRFDAAGKPIGGASTIYVVSSESHSSYNALQASLSKNTARWGTGLQINYTYSKSIDDTSSVQGGSIAGAGVILQTSPQDPWNPAAERGPSTFDVTQVFTFSWIQVLPLNQREFPAFRSALLDRWLAVSRHHDLHHRFSLHRLFRGAADRCRRQRSRSP